jgi:hypothetical protein
MGIFSRRPKSVSLHSSLSSSSLASPVFPAAELEAPQPSVTIRVALDPPPRGSEDGLFSLTLDPRDDISSVREAVIAHLGDVSVSLFKVCQALYLADQQVVIPWQAQVQARAYTQQYGIPVNLATAFPAFNLDAPEQMQASFGPAGWQAIGHEGPQNIGHWWPEGTSSDNISLLVRTAEGSSSE